MKKTALVMMISLTALTGVCNAEEDTSSLRKEAVSIVKQFGGQLKPELMKAIKSGGPASAITVCSEKAPAIAKSLSEKTGWTVKRVSLKPRNQSSAVADSWEQKVLMAFDQRQAEGEEAAKIHHSEMVNGQFRFMKAQGVAPVCLNCHADNIKPEVEAALKKYYPNDQARGYSEGQIRGAFSLTKTF